MALRFPREIGCVRCKDEEPEMEDVVLGNREGSYMPQIKGSRRREMRLEE